MAVKAGVGQVAGFGLPFGEASVVEHFLGVFDDERRDVVAEAFLQGD